MPVKVLEDKCDGCCTCETQCPTECIKVDPATQKAVAKDDDCIDCAACIDNCPQQAIETK